MFAFPKYSIKKVFRLYRPNNHDKLIRERRRKRRRGRYVMGPQKGRQ